GRIRSTGLQATRRRREYGAGGGLVSVLRSLARAIGGDGGGWGFERRMVPRPLLGATERRRRRGGARPPLGPQAALGRRRTAATKEAGCDRRSVPSPLPCDNRPGVGGRAIGRLGLLSQPQSSTRSV